MYSETLIDHFEHPRNVGELERADAEAEDENPVCGDRLRIWLRIGDGRVQEMRWRAAGCVPAIAAASVTSQMVEGMSVDDARSLSRDQIADALGGLPARKAHASALAASALHKALALLPESET